MAPPKGDPRPFPLEKLHRNSVLITHLIDKNDEIR